MKYGYLVDGELKEPIEYTWDEIRAKISRKENTNTATAVNGADIYLLGIFALVGGSVMLLSALKSKKKKENLSPEAETAPKAEPTPQALPEEPVVPVMEEKPAAPAAEETPAGSPSGPKFCSECGKPVIPGAKFCPECGKPLNSRED